jgi:hypothetical protein
MQVTGISANLPVADVAAASVFYREYLAPQEPRIARAERGAVAWALLALATAFKLGTRDEVRELLESLRPKLAAEPQSPVFADVQAAKDRLAAALAEGRISPEDLLGRVPLRPWASP